MSRCIDITDQIFTDLTAKRLAGRNKHGHPLWECSCACGTTTIVSGSNLRGGHTKSCGCRVKTHSGRWSHGLLSNPINKPTYRIWIQMKARCLNPNYTHWRYYGGKGITICPQWIDSFETFLNDMGLRPDGLTIDRIDPLGNYEPDNCRWVSQKTQVRNRSTNKLNLETVKQFRQRAADGERVSSLAKEYNIKRGYAYLVLAGKTWK
jgi:hypothetical protein